MSALLELDSLEILVIVDNEVDPISKYPHPAVSGYGNLADIAVGSPYRPSDRPKGGDVREVKMEQICCGAHGLSLMVVSCLVSSPLCAL
jgi:7,8-dihydropterin-6-yl-methyl-4-(beta-D-ribofuranosyl)aminobenzene 5'-phosphate synthase